MPLAWNEIRQRAIAFSREWGDAARERSESQSFWNDFFHVFGKSRKMVATFEEPVKNLGGHTDFIDVFWKGRMIGESKSRGKDLGLAASQAFNYGQNLINDGREDEAPRWVVTTDFEFMVVHDLEAEDEKDKSHRFRVKDLHKEVRRFGFIAGYQTRRLDPEDPANLKAAALLANLHDRLEDGGYTGHDLQVFMVRVLFCLFAEDTEALPRDALKRFVQHHTREDGSDLGSQLAQFFQTLDTPRDKRQANLLEELAELPYVNGALFGEQLRFASFNAAMRTALQQCSHFRWEEISPAIFGSLFQGIMEPRERRELGAHYTSERDILKLIRSLFLDRLRADFEKAKKVSRPEVDRFHEKLGSLKFLDPACGCGNFLLIAYRELRLLELELLQWRYPPKEQGALDFQVRDLLKVNVDQFFGIEIEEWPARIAEVAMWLLDHQMNVAVSEAFGQLVARFPLKARPGIVHGNALRLDWEEVLPAGECSYVMGNPPFIGHHYQSAEQKADQADNLARISASGVLDFVANWFVKAADFIDETPIVAGFVATNSISQGEQPGILWSHLFAAFDISIHFAHSTFEWTSEARGKAHVHVVIVGFGAPGADGKHIVSYDTVSGVPARAEVKNISPYLVEGADIVVTTRSKPLGEVPAMKWGNKPTDGGNFLMSCLERDQLLKEVPDAEKYVRPFIGGGDFLNGRVRYCLWLVDAEPAELRSMPPVMERIAAVRAFREASKAKSTREWAKQPTLFRQISQPDSDYLAVPEVSSGGRSYIPIAFFTSETICSNTVQFVADATPWHFGILTSAMHMSWVRMIAGRLKSDPRYSNSLVYNNFPWPDPTDAQRDRVSTAARGVLEARERYPDATLADLYDPLTTPAPLAKAHTTLDRAVDACYRSQPFPDERRRFEHLFERYEALVTPLAVSTS